MGFESETDDRAYTVLVNDEEQYSLWLAHRAIPAGWRAAGKVGSKQECLAYVEAHWTDLRPRSLRERAAQAPEA
jgi:MbtH protein